MGPEAYRRLLLEKKADLLRKSASAHTDPRGAGGVPEDDVPLVLHDQYISLEVKRRDHETLSRINHALERLASGEFGICAECGDPIPPKRLQALPWAHCCIRCEERVAAATADAMV